ncbi:MAG: hypothetical protein AAFP70_05400 [Calditrichota bacterium]
MKRIMLILIIAVAFSSCGKEETTQLSERELYNRGMELALDGKFKDAQDLFQESLDMNPLYWPAEGSVRITNRVLSGQMAEKAALHMFRGIEYGNNRDQHRKVLELNEAIELSPDCALAYNERGVAYYKMNMLVQAIADRNRAIMLEPTYAAPYYNKAVACEQAGRMWEAVDAYKGFIKNAPPYYEIHIEHARKRIVEITQEMTGVEDLEAVSI